MGFFKPELPSFHYSDLQKSAFPHRLKMLCQNWAEQGAGIPTAIYIGYVFKAFLYVAGWVLICSRTGLGSIDHLMDWWAAPVAIQKAVVWSMLIENMGFGSASGPLMGRFFPPIGCALYFTRVGTTKMPFSSKLPFIGRNRRGYADVALYVVHLIFLVRILAASELSPMMFVPTLILLPILGLSDKTIFLSARSEHYLTAFVCFMFPGDMISGLKWLWFAIWTWAAVSKMTQHFPSVVAAMAANNPVIRFLPIHKLMYRKFPEDLRPSSVSNYLAHFGVFIEGVIPFFLMFAQSDAVVLGALVIITLFHLQIVMSFPIAAPIEWNFATVYGAWALFGHWGTISPISLQSPVLMGLLIIPLFLLPLIGNFFPSKVSFLISMRYYAGNWPYSIWLFKKGSFEKLDLKLVKSSLSPLKQLLRIYDFDTANIMIDRVIGFRCLHLQARVLHSLIPRAVVDIEDYEWVDGDVVAGLALGWNFGDGHLSTLQLLASIQEQCQFAPDELKYIFVESQPLFGSQMEWIIADAATGVLEVGQTPVNDLVPLQPWPDGMPSKQNNSQVS